MLKGKLFALLCVFTTSIHAADLVPFEANYSSEYGMLSATGIRKLEKHSDGNWFFSNSAKAMFAEVIENSTFAVKSGQVTSLNYNFKNPFNSKRDMAVTFDWQGQKAVNDKQGVTLPLQGEIYDKLSYQVQMQKDVCANPEKYGKDFTLIDTKKLKTYRVEFAGREQLKTKVGTLNTIRLRQFRPDKRDGKDTTIWLAADFNCLLTRLDQYEGDDIIRLDLTSAKVDGKEVKGK